LLLCDIDGPGLSKAKKQLTSQGIRSEIVEGDVARPEIAEAAAELAFESFGSLEILVNGAGLIRDARIEQTAEEDWDRTHAVNLKAPYLFCRRVIPGMREQGYGRIVNIGSRAWLGGFGQASYASSKGGLVSLTRSLAIELAAKGVTVNTVAPGTVDTPMFRSFATDVQAKLLETQPSGRLGTPDEVAAAVHFLASPEASYVTGQTLHVCGGRSLVVGPGHEG
jgi:3-oxoacyl-[acyl-carrier protein] reductase